MKELTIHYGALADPIETQLYKRGYTLGEKQDFINQLQHSLTMCMFHLLTEAQYQSLLKKFHKTVMRYVKPLEETK